MGRAKWVGSEFLSIIYRYRLTFFFFQAEDGIRDTSVTGVQTCAIPIYLQGIWQVLNTASWDIQDHGANLGVPAGHGVVEGNEIPYTPAALAKKQENSRNRQALDPLNKCFLPGVPRVMYLPYPFQIVQQRDRVDILHEYSRVIRYIYMHGNPHPPG